MSRRGGWGRWIGGNRSVPSATGEQGVADRRRSQRPVSGKTSTSARKRGSVELIVGRMPRSIETPGSSGPRSSWPADRAWSQYPPVPDGHRYPTSAWIRPTKADPEQAMEGARRQFQTWMKHECSEITTEPKGRSSDPLVGDKTGVSDGANSGRASRQRARHMDAASGRHDLPNQMISSMTNQRKSLHDL